MIITTYEQGNSILSFIRAPAAGSDLGGATTDLGVPEFNGPVEGRAEEILREVNGAGN